MSSIMNISIFMAVLLDDINYFNISVFLLDQRNFRSTS